MEEGYGLVLSGGGTKGAYEVGAWKALKKMKIPISAIVGTSIGAINGAMMLQDDQRQMENIYLQIQMSDIFETSDAIDTSKSLFSLDNIRGLIKEYFMQRGLDTAPLEKLIRDNIDLDKIYQSDIDFGIVTYSIKELTAIEKYKNEKHRSNRSWHYGKRNCPYFCTNWF